MPILSHHHKLLKLLFAIPETGRRRLCLTDQKIDKSVIWCYYFNVSSFHPLPHTPMFITLSQMPMDILLFATLYLCCVVPSSLFAVLSYLLSKGVLKLTFQQVIEKLNILSLFPFVLLLVDVFLRILWVISHSPDL